MNSDPAITLHPSAFEVGSGNDYKPVHLQVGATVQHQANHPYMTPHVLAVKGGTTYNISATGTESGDRHLWLLIHDPVEDYLSYDSATSSGSGSNTVSVQYTPVDDGFIFITGFMNNPQNVDGYADILVTEV